MTTVHKYLGKARIGWHFMADVGHLRTEGWRPTRRSAEAAASRWARRARQSLQRTRQTPSSSARRRSRHYADR